MPDLIPYPPALSHPGLGELRFSLPDPPSPLPSYLDLALPPPDLLRVAARLAELYELVFPDRPGWREEVIDWEGESDAVVAIHGFLQAAGDLFPVREMFWEDDLEWAEGWLYDIPVAPCGFDVWHDEWDDFGEPVPYLLDLIYGRSDHPDPEEANGRYAPYVTPPDLVAEALVKALRRMALPSPLNALPDLIRMLTHSTGNAWLDVGEIGLMEGGGYPRWNRDDVTWLASSWQEARPILERINALLRWREEDPAAVAKKLAAVHTALMNAHHGTGK